MLGTLRALAAPRWFQQCQRSLPAVCIARSLHTARLCKPPLTNISHAFNSREARSASFRAGSQGAAHMSTVAADSSDTGAVVVYVTVPDRDTGRKIANSLVENKLAACVNIIPGLESIYFWEGKVNSDEELLLMIKSRQALVPALTQAVKSLHPYTECEVISVPITGGSASYLKWVFDSTKESS